MKYYFVSDGTWGDILPFIFVAKELVLKGHNVTLFSSEEFAVHSKSKGIPFVETTSKRDRDEFISNPDLWDPKKGMGVIGKYAGSMYKKTIPVLEKEILTSKPDMIVAHAFAYGAKTMAEKYSITYASILISPIQIRSTYRLPIFYGGKDPNTIPHIFKKLVYPLVDRFLLDPLFDKYINRSRCEMGLSPISSFVHWSTWSDLTIALWPEWHLQKELDYQSYIKLVGFPKNVEIETDLNEKLLEWVMAGSKPIVATLGSGYIFGEKFFSNLETLSRTTEERIIFVGPLNKHGDISRDRNIISLPYVAFSKILPLCKTVIHHGGAGTLSQVISAGIPHIVIPQSHDQPDNAGIIKQNNLGEIIWNRCPNVEEILKAIKTIDAGEVIKSACAKAKEKFDNDEDGIKKASEYIINFKNN